MRRLCLGVVLSLLLAAPGFAAPKFVPARENAVPDQYMVLLKDGGAKAPGAPGGTVVDAIAADLAQRYGGKVLRVWSHALRGFSVRLSEPAARVLANDPRVVRVEQDSRLILSTVTDCRLGVPDTQVQQHPFPSSPQGIVCSDPLGDNCKDNWGLDRIDAPTLDGLYHFSLTGAGVHVYVIDSGLEARHEEFLDRAGNSRIRPGINFTDSGGPDDFNTDSTPHGHGTHVAAIIAGRTYGVAKEAFIHPVKVGSSDGLTSNYVSGFDWVAANRILPAVANLSGANILGWNRDGALQEAVRGMMDSGVALIQAAGNQEKDACLFSLGNPYSVPGTIVVGGTDILDGRYREQRVFPHQTDFGSNTGRCVGLWAPGDEILSASKQPDNPNDPSSPYTKYCLLSGTSMAAPHATGVAALFLQLYDRPTQHVPAGAVKTALRAAAVGGKLQVALPAGIGSDSPNLLLQTQFPVDGPPAVGDDWLLAAGAPIHINYADLLANDFDWGGRSLTVTSVQAPAHGVLTFDATGFTYNPDTYVGNESFTYQVNNSASLTSIGQITVLDTRPVAVDDHLTFIEGTSRSFSTDLLVQNDFDPDGSAVGQGAVSFAGFVGNPAHGSLQLQSGNVWQYTPRIPFPGRDSVGYLVTDDEGHTAQGTLFFSSYPAGGTGGDPQANLDTATTRQEVPVTIDVTANDEVAPLGNLDVIGMTTPAHGTVGFATGSNSVVVYTPQSGYAGFDSFTYLVRSQGQAVSGGSVSIEIVPQPPGPVARPDFFTTQRDTQLAIGYTGLLANDSGSGLTFRIDLFTNPAHGTLDFCCNAGAFKYNPNPGYVGPDSFEYFIQDNLGHQPVHATVYIDVVFTNHPPVAANDMVTTEQDTPITILVLNNDTDPDGDTLTVTGVTTPSSGTAVINNGTTITYTPALGVTGDATFYYTIKDSHDSPAANPALVTVHVRLNHTPTPHPDSFSTPRNTPLDFTYAQLLANDTDPDGDPLTVTSVTGVPCSGGVCHYTPSAGFVGNAGPFNYTVTDNRPNGMVGSTITINVFNRAPVAVNDVASTPQNTPVTINVRANDSDPDGDPITVNAITAQPAAGTGTCAVASGGTGVVYTPPAGFMKQTTCSYTVTDGLATSAPPATITLYINRPPIARGDQIRIPFATQTQIARATLLANDFDPDGDTLTISNFNTTGMNGTLSCPAGGTACTYTPGSGFAGVTQFTYTVTDGRNGFSTASVKLKVGVVQNLPVANDDLLTTTLNAPKAFTVLDVLANDTDVDGDVLTATIGSGLRDYGSVSCDTFNCTYTPNTGFVGSDRFSYTASDGADGSATAYIKMMVLPPATPTFDAQEDQLSTPQNTSLFFTRGYLTSNDYSPTGDPLTITSFDTTGLNGTLDCTSDTFGCIYHPGSYFAGITHFKYTVSDTHGHSDTAIVKIKVGIANTAPVAANDSLTTRANTPLTFSVFELLKNDVDAQNDPMTVYVYPYPSHGTLSCSTPNYWCTYTPAAGYTGTDSFNYIVSDGISYSNQATVTVTVQPVLAKDAVIVSQSVPASMTMGQTYPVSLTIKNIGTVAWSLVGPLCNAFRLGAVNPYDNATWGSSRAELPSTVAANGQVTVTFNVTAPAAPGPYNFQRRMVHECVEWFGDLSPNVVVSVHP